MFNRKIILFIIAVARNKIENTKAHYRQSHLFSNFINIEPLFFYAAFKNNSDRK